MQQGAWNEQSQVVVETVTKSSTTQSYAAVQSGFQSDATKVVARGMGLQKAMLNKETSFTVDASQAGGCLLCFINHYHIFRIKF